MSKPSALATVAAAAAAAQPEAAAAAIAEGAAPETAAPVAVASADNALTAVKAPVTAAYALGLMANAFPAMATVFTSLEATCNVGATEAEFAGAVIKVMATAAPVTASAGETAAATAHRPLNNAAPDNAVVAPRAHTEVPSPESVYAARSEAMTSPQTVQ